MRIQTYVKRNGHNCVASTYTIIICKTQLNQEFQRERPDDGMHTCGREILLSI